MGEKLSGLEEKRNRVGEQLIDAGDMRQGSLTERYLKCGKPQCRCTKEESYKARQASVGSSTLAT